MLDGLMIVDDSFDSHGNSGAKLFKAHERLQGEVGVQRKITNTNKNS